MDWFLRAAASRASMWRLVHAVGSPTYNKSTYPGCVTFLIKHAVDHDLDTHRSTEQCFGRRTQLPHLCDLTWPTTLVFAVDLPGRVKVQIFLQRAVI